MVQKVIIILFQQGRNHFQREIAMFKMYSHSKSGAIRHVPSLLIPGSGEGAEAAKSLTRNKGRDRDPL